MMKGKTFRGAALAMLPALCLALCLTAPAPAIAEESSTTDVTVVSAGFWPAQETSTVDVRTPSSVSQQPGLLSQTSDASFMAVLACTAASSMALIASLTRRDS